jgi:hypothetical protein
LQAGAAGGNQQGVLPALFGFQLGPGVSACHWQQLSCSWSVCSAQQCRALQSCTAAAVALLAACYGAQACQCLGPPTALCDLDIVQHYARQLSTSCYSNVCCHLLPQGKAMWRHSPQSSSIR